MRKFNIAIVGNPNCGKTTLFNQLTGAKQSVGNWPGVTVERKQGFYSSEDKQFQVVDLPGIYSLSATSLDEQVARRYILESKPDLIVNIVDASNLERNLYLTTQLIEMKVPFILVLNMMDVAKEKKIKINITELAHLLDCPVAGIVANKREGIGELRNFIDSAAESKNISKANIYFPDEIEEIINKIISRIEVEARLSTQDKRWLAIKLIEGDTIDSGVLNSKELKDIVAAAKHQIEKIMGEEPDIVIVDSRYGFINAVCKKTVDKTDILRKDITNIIDRVVLSRSLGIPLFIIAMYLTFWITINLGSCFIDFFDIFTGSIFVEGFGKLLSLWHVPEFVRVILADGIGGGIQTVSTFIPPIFFMFLCLAFLEDSGYMSRAAFLMDGLMRKIGLPGKAFVPLLIGFGCNVPAIMASRTLSQERDRILSVIMNPFMSCGARMPVYAVFAAAFFPYNGGLVIFSLYLIGIILAILTAFLLKSTILKGEPSSFIMELPPYHIPTVRGIMTHTWHRLKGFILRAGQAIVIVVLFLGVINSLGVDGSFGNQNTEKSLLSQGAKLIVPVFKPMGIKEDNWPAVVGIISGIFAKESVVGSLNSIYGQMDNYNSDSYAESFGFINKMKEAIASIKNNLADLKPPFFIAGLFKNKEEIEDIFVAQKKLYVSLSNRFDGKAGAFSYMLMILLYMPCVASIAAVYKELNLRWAIFSCVYLSLLAWLMATLFYQIASFNLHPKESWGWITFVVATIIVFIIFLRIRGRSALGGKI